MSIADQVKPFVVVLTAALNDGDGVLTMDHLPPVEDVMATCIGGGPYTFLCGRCHFPIAQYVAFDVVRKRALRCRRCKCQNQALPATVISPTEVTSDFGQQLLNGMLISLVDPV